MSSVYTWKCLPFGALTLTQGTIRLKLILSYNFNQKWLAMSERSESNGGDGGN